MDALDLAACAGPLTLRNWRPGDRLHPSGGSEQKIKTFFQEHRVPLWRRRNWPVIESNGRVVWTRDFGTDRNFSARPESEQTLLIRETGESKDAFQTSVSLRSREIERAESRLPTSGARGAEAS